MKPSGRVWQISNGCGKEKAADPAWVAYIDGAIEVNLGRYDEALGHFANALRLARGNQEFIDAVQSGVQAANAGKLAMIMIWGA